MNSENVSDRFGRLAQIVTGMSLRMRPDEDFLQASLLKLWELLQRQSDRADCYIVAAVRCALIDELRYRKVRSRLKHTGDSRELEAAVAADEAAAGDAGQRVEELLAGLDPPMRDAFVLHYLESRTVAETAERIGKPIRTTERLIHKAKAILRKIIEK